MSLTTTIKKLRKLNEPVPEPLRLPTEDEVAAAESALGVKFPADYRYYLLQGSDVTCGTLEPAVVTPDAGHLDLVEIVETAREMDLPEGYLPFCEDNGDYYCFTPDGSIVFWSHDGESSESWPDLAHWIQEVWIDEA